PRMLIATRFGLGIRDPAWFEHRLVVMSAITVPSLMAQDDQEFDWGIFVEPDLSSDIRRALDTLIEPFDGRAFIDTHGHTPENLLKIATERNLVHPSGHVLLGRIDDDDAWAVGTVHRVREYTANWMRCQGDAPGFGLTFENGLVWIMYDMLDVDHLQSRGDAKPRCASIRPYTCPWASISEFVYAPLSTGVTPIAGSHANVPKELTAQGFDIEVLGNDQPMWLYCRHKQADSAIERAAADSPNLELRVDELSGMFGIDSTKALDYIANAGTFGYTIKKRLFDRRGELHDAFVDAGSRAAVANLSELEANSLKLKEFRRREEWAQLGSNLIAKPSDGAGPIDFCHILQTQFSVRSPSGFQEFSSDWLQRRLEFFDVYCLPSVSAQTCGTFIWHVYCDETTDRGILEQLRHRARQLPQMRIALTGPSCREPTEHVLDDVQFGARALLTTHLDSDGAISRHYVGAIQRHVDGFATTDSASLLLNFPRGYQLDPTTGCLSPEFRAPSSGFHTLFERVTAEVSTVLNEDHSTLQETQATEQDESIRAWMAMAREGRGLSSPKDLHIDEASVEQLADFGITADRALLGKQGGG
ncbi:MAG TPA: glycosyltransferase, partial [Solirubrobacterales bacterium]|nr:glycosyltransferase [Solirubrobacterales bacterium]